MWHRQSTLWNCLAINFSWNLNFQFHINEMAFHAWNTQMRIVLSAWFTFCLLDPSIHYVLSMYRLCWVYLQITESCYGVLSCLNFLPPCNWQVVAEEWIVCGLISKSHFCQLGLEYMLTLILSWVILPLSLKTLTFPSYFILHWSSPFLFSWTSNLLIYWVL